MQMAWSETPLCVLRTWGMEYGNIAWASIALYVALGQLKHTTSGQQHAATTPKGHAGVSVHPPTAHTLTPTQSRTCSGARGRTMMPTIWWMPCSEGGGKHVHIATSMGTLTEMKTVWMLWGGVGHYPLHHGLQLTAGCHGNSPRESPGMCVPVQTQRQRSWPVLQRS